MSICRYYVTWVAIDVLFQANIMDGASLAWNHIELTLEGLHQSKHLVTPSKLQLTHVSFLWYLLFENLQGCLLPRHHALNNRQCLREILEDDMFDPFPPAICREVVLVVLRLDEEDIGVCSCGHI